MSVSPRSSLPTALALLLAGCALASPPRASAPPTDPTRVGAPPHCKGLRVPSPQAYYEFLLAELAEGRGDRQGARTSYRRALVEDPDSPELRVRLADLALEQGDEREALRLVEEARAVAPAYPRAHLMAARIWRERDPVRASILLRKVISLEPRMARAYLWLAPLERLRKGAEVEQQVYRRLLGVHPEHLEGLLGLARSLGRIRRDEEAARILEKACRAHPFAVDPWLQLARVRIGQGRWALAARWLYEGLEATGDDPMLAEELFRVWLAQGRSDRARDLVVLLEGHEAAATMTLVAGLRDRLGDEAGAEKTLLEARQQDPSFGPALAELARLLRRRGEAKAAARLLSEVLPSQAPWVEARLELATLLEAQGEITRAELVLHGILKDRPREAAAAESLAFLQARTYRRDLAMESLEKARAARGLSRDDPSYRYSRMLLFEEAGQWAEVERLAARQIEADPDDPQVLNLLGYGLADRGIDLPRATRLLVRAQRLDPMNPHILDSLGWAIARQGLPGAALPWLERAVRLDRRLCEAWIHLAQVRQAARMPSQAREAWKEALACGPGASARAAVLGRLRLGQGSPRTPREPWAPRARTRSYR